MRSTWRPGSEEITDVAPVEMLVDEDEDEDLHHKIYISK